MKNVNDSGEACFYVVFSRPCLHPSTPTHTYRRTDTLDNCTANCFLGEFRSNKHLRSVDLGPFFPLPSSTFSDVRGSRHFKMRGMNLMSLLRKFVGGGVLRRERPPGAAALWEGNCMRCFPSSAPVCRRALVTSSHTALRPFLPRTA